jgi:hypothetical protein
MKTTTNVLEVPVGASVLSIKECLRRIGIQEVTANVFMVPPKKISK